MAGHSHAANIAHRKGLVDAKRGKLFSKLCRAIYVAAKSGGADPNSNLRLRYAIDKARSVSCPKENIERAIKKGTGELGGESFEEIIYEGYGPSGVAVMCEILTDNRNRTAGELRKIFDICGGSLGSTGCVSYLFSYKGLFLVPLKSATEEQLMETALEAGADDIVTGEEFFEITCDPKSFDDVKKALEEARIVTETAEMRHLPSNSVHLDADSARKMLKLRDLLDENDDVQNVYSNEIIPEEILAETA
ncbi:YebC/PmpR family DNA-binding transcriptional regulator [bacterium]|nr:YebC/PmpR family DNA-binding transcriptional regulator [bacterium]